MASSKTKKAGRKPYDELSDDEKIQKNWNKALGLYDRGEWSVAILRCATCLELAVNFAIREELAGERNLPLLFVDKLLRSANGIHSKYNNIYLPIMDEYREVEDLKRLWSDHVMKVNEERNGVAHRGEFRGKVKALTVMSHTQAALLSLLDLHGSKAKLKALDT